MKTINLKSASTNYQRGIKTSEDFAEMAIAFIELSYSSFLNILFILKALSTRTLLRLWKIVRMI